MEETTETNFNAITRSERVNADTGELIGISQVPDGAGYSIISAEQSEIAAKKKQQKKNREKDGKHFAMMYREQPTLSLLNAGYLMRLLPYIDLGTHGKLCGALGDPLTFDDIAKIFGRQTRATVDILQELEQAGAITKRRPSRNNVFYVNPEVCRVGAKQNAKPFIKFYKVQGRELLRKLKPSEAGLLFKLAPYLHFQKLVLCKNPDSDPVNEVIEAFSREELSNELGIDLTTLKKNLKGLRAKRAILVTMPGGRCNFYAHPDIYNRGIEDGWSKSLRQQFRDLEGGR
jgi:hypothetical protein